LGREHLRLSARARPGKQTLTASVRAVAWVRSGGQALLRKLGPRRGWRHFAGEVGVIILGVLIALGLGAIANEIGWRNEVRQARRALSLELGEAMGQVVERTRFSPCVEHRLDQIAQLVDEAALAGRLPPLGDIGAPSFRTWPHGVWDSIVNSQAAAHFDREELGAISSIYEFVVILGQVNRRELDVWTRLYTVVGPGRKMLPAEAADLRQAIGEARLVNRSLALTGIRAKQTAEAYGVPFDAAAGREYVERPLSEFAICRPIGPNAPHHYGQAPLYNIIERALGTPVTRP
jgi:hypothetical protein